MGLVVGLDSSTKATMAIAWDARIWWRKGVRWCTWRNVQPGASQLGSLQARRMISPAPTPTGGSPLARSSNRPAMAKG